MNTIADFLIQCVNGVSANRRRQPFWVRGMGEIWKFIPDQKYGPGYLVNYSTGSVMGVAELSDRVIDPANNDWGVIYVDSSAR